MNNDSPRFFAIGKIDIDEAFLDQVALSRMKCAQAKPGTLANGHAASSPSPDTITPQMRAEAKSFIEEYFLTK